MSRSPPRFSGRRPERDKYARDKGSSRPELDKGRSEGGHRESKERLSREQSVSDRGQNPVAAASIRQKAETRNNQAQDNSHSKQDLGHSLDKCVSSILVISPY